MKKGGALSPLLLNFALGYAIRRVQVNQDGLKLNGTHQLLVYVDDVNILGGSIHTVKENAETLIVASKEIRLEVNADKTRSHNMKILQKGERVQMFGNNLNKQKFYSRRN